MRADELPNSVEEINRSEAARKRYERSKAWERFWSRLGKVIEWLVRPPGMRL